MDHDQILTTRADPVSSVNAPSKMESMNSTGEIYKDHNNNYIDNSLNYHEHEERRISGEENFDIMTVHDQLPLGVDATSITADSHFLSPRRPLDLSMKKQTPSQNNESSQQIQKRGKNHFRCQKSKSFFNELLEITESYREFFDRQFYESTCCSSDHENKLSLSGSFKKIPSPNSEPEQVEGASQRFQFMNRLDPDHLESVNHQQLTSGNKDFCQPGIHNIIQDSEMISVYDIPPISSVSQMTFNVTEPWKFSERKEQNLLDTDQLKVNKTTHQDTIPDNLIQQSVSSSIISEEEENLPIIQNETVNETWKLVPCDFSSASKSYSRQHASANKTTKSKFPCDPRKELMLQKDNIPQVKIGESNIVTILDRSLSTCINQDFVLPRHLDCSDNEAKHNEPLVKQVSSSVSISSANIVNQSTEKSYFRPILPKPSVVSHSSMSSAKASGRETQPQRPIAQILPMNLSNIGLNQNNSVDYNNIVTSSIATTVNISPGPDPIILPLFPSSSAHINPSNSFGTVNQGQLPLQNVNIPSTVSGSVLQPNQIPHQIALPLNHGLNNPVEPVGLHGQPMSSSGSGDLSQLGLSCGWCGLWCSNHESMNKHHSDTHRGSPYKCIDWQHYVSLYQITQFIVGNGQEQSSSTTTLTSLEANDQTLSPASQIQSNYIADMLPEVKVTTVRPTVATTNKIPDGGTRSQIDEFKTVRQNSEFQCSQDGCQKPFSTLIALHQHNLSVHGNDIGVYSSDSDSFVGYICHPCQKSFRTVVSLIQHTKDAHPQEEIVVRNLHCFVPQCREVFKDKEERKIHMRYHNSKKMAAKKAHDALIPHLSCFVPDCREKFVTKQDRKEHMIQVHEKKILVKIPCFSPNCSVTFRSKLERNLHMRESHHSGNVFLKTTHKNRSKPEKRFIKAMRNSKDVSQNKKQRNKNGKKSAKNKKNTKQTEIFPLMDIAFQSATDNNMESANFSRQETNLNNIPACSTNATSTLTSSKMETSDKKPIETLPFMCLHDSCEKMFESEAELFTHVPCHAKEKPYVCPMDGCGRSYRKKNVLLEHKRTHAESYRFVCPEKGCGKIFKTRGTLKHHRFVHSTDTPHHCPVGCGKSFKSKDLLKSHLKIHSSERPFVCQRCLQTFKWKSSLNSHEKTHLPPAVGDTEKLLTCSKCSRVFVDEAQLNNHVESHSTELLLLCPFPGCKRRYKYHFGLDAHMLSHN